MIYKVSCVKVDDLSFLHDKENLALRIISTERFLYNMASVRNFRVVFDKVSAAYEPGEVVSGKIIVDTTREKYVKGLYLIANGSAFVHWLENDPLDDLRSQSFASSEEYFSFKHDVFGIPDCQAGHKIPYGHNEYTFSFRLPREIPCSFEDTTGYVRYTVKVVIERPWKFDHECKAAFSVISRLDLNIHREKCMAIHDETSKSFNCLCWIGQGSMSLQVMVPCSGYAPGQSITTTIQYTSSPIIPIRKLSTKLLRKTYFRTTANTLTHKCTIQKSRHSRPLPGNGRIASELLIPPIPPSNLHYCRIIDIEYALVVSVHVSGPYTKIKRTYPLLIGTIPLYRPALTFLHSVVPCSTMPFIAQPSVMTNPLSMPEQSNASTIPMQERTNISSAHLDIPLPTYEEGLSETPSIKDIHESDFIFGVNIPFFPRYPVYKYPAPRLPNERL